MPDLILHELQQRGFGGIELCMLDWPACSPDLSPIENVCRIMKRRIRWTVEQLKSCIHQEWTKIPLAKRQQLISSVPKRLQSVIKRKCDDTLHVI